MVLPLDPREELIIVPVRLFGHNKELILRFAIDTAATSSMIGWEQASRLGYVRSALPDHMHITTASGTELVQQITLNAIEAFGQRLYEFPVLCHTLPLEISFDGLLGLDFFRGRRLTIDLRVGIVTLD